MAEAVTQARFLAEHLGLQLIVGNDARGGRFRLQRGRDFLCVSDCIKEITGFLSSWSSMSADASLTGWAARKAQAQQQTHVRLCGIPYARQPYGPDHPQGGSTCRDCGVERGHLHVPSCCIERCPICSGQAIGCACADGEETTA